MKEYHFYIDCLVNSGPGNALLALSDALISNGFAVNIHVLETIDENCAIPKGAKIILNKDTKKTMVGRLINITKILALFLSLQKRHHQETDQVHIVYSFLSLGMMQYVYNQSCVYHFVLHANPVNLKEIHTTRFAKFWLKTNIYFMKYAHTIICVSHSVEASLISDIAIPKNTKVTSILNLCNISQLDVAKKKAEGINLDLQVVDKRIVYIGRIIPQKGIDLLLRIVQALKDDYNVQLVIVGDGPLEYVEKIMSDIEKFDISNNVLLAGYQQDTMPYMLQSDLFILPSKSEGLPISILDALFVGCPVVASNVEGCIDILNYKGKHYGGLCDRTVEAFVNEIVLNFECRVSYEAFDCLVYNHDQIELWINI